MSLNSITNSRIFNVLRGGSPVVIEINDVQYKNFKSVNVEAAVDNIARSFIATLTANTLGVAFGITTPQTTFPFNIGDRVSVIIEGEYVFTGFIEEIDSEYDNSNHDITISGRDKLSDVIDCSLLKQVSFQPTRHLRHIIKDILNNNNITAKNIVSAHSSRGRLEGFVGIIDFAEPKEFGEGDLVEGHVGENLFEVINSYAMRRQVLVTSDGNGNLVITRGGRFSFQSSLVHKNAPSPSNIEEQVTNQFLNSNSRSNNILGASVNYDNGSRFNKYIFISQKNLTESAKLGGSMNAEDVTLQIGEATDTQIRASRTLVIGADNARATEFTQERSVWEANVRRTRGKKYTCTVEGFKPQRDAGVWEPNHLINVQDEKMDIDSLMLITSVSYSFSNEGSKTKLEFGEKNAFRLEANITEFDSRTNTVGGAKY